VAPDGPGDPPAHGDRGSTWTPALRTQGAYGVKGPSGEWWVGPRLSRAGARRFARITGGVVVEPEEAETSRLLDELSRKISEYE